MQNEIYVLLRQNRGRKFTTNEIAETTGLNKKGIRLGVSKLIKHKMIFAERKIKKTKKGATQWRVWL